MSMKSPMRGRARGRRRAGHREILSREARADGDFVLERLSVWTIVTQGRERLT